MNIEEFYRTMEYLNRKGTPLSDEQKKSIEEAEDEYVMQDVIPLIRQAAEEAISKLRCPIRITVDNIPGESVSIDYLRPQQEERKEEKEIPCPPEPIGVENADDATDKAAKAERKQKRVSVGFTVRFGDGTVFHERKAVGTWIKALKKIGLEFIYNNRNRHGAWHQVEEKDICIVERQEILRDRNVSPPQKLVDGFYVLRQLSNEQKVKDLRILADFLPNLGIQVEWDDEEQEEADYEPMTFLGDDAENVVENTDDVSGGYLVRSHTVNGFVLDVVKQLYHLDKLDSIKPYFRRNQLIAVSKDGEFNLNGMFVSCSYDELLERNTRSTSTRWFDTPFEVDGETLYLSNQWVDKEHGSLRLSDFRKMIEICYQRLLEVRKLANGTYVLKEY